jgi:hypothetical protein
VRPKLSCACSSLSIAKCSELATVESHYASLIEKKGSHHGPLECFKREHPILKLRYCYKRVLVNKLF